MALIAGGFMVVPSEFPGWLRWAYNVPFHTYSWRTFMYNEFHNQSFPDAAESGFEDGETILKIYEIENVNRGNDMIIMLCYEKEYFGGCVMEQHKINGTEYKDLTPIE
eukprot:8180926-Ditylum_brightwellii.AAC.1